MPRYVLLRKDRLRAAYAKLGQKETYVNVSFNIHHDRLQTQSWWELKEREGREPVDPCFEVLRGSVLGSKNRARAKVLSIVTYNERVSDSLFGKVFSNYGFVQFSFYVILEYFLFSLPQSSLHLCQSGPSIYLFRHFIMRQEVVRNRL